MNRRLPAEWEEQECVLMAWPHAGTDWAPHLDEVEPVFREIASCISQYEKLFVVGSKKQVIEAKLLAAGAHMDRVRVLDIQTNDTWARDFGPVSVASDGGLVLLDFGFNGWGLKFPADQDNQVTRRLCGGGTFGAVRMETVGMILEGGSIESDGQGTILTTSECLLGPNRNPHLSRNDIENALRQHLGADRILWLDNGSLAGDDTDAHIDTLARFAPGGIILHVSCLDPADEHCAGIGLMAGQLSSFRDRQGRPYRLLPLPWPSARYDELGQRLPATYANFLVINDAVLVPTYRDGNDGKAMKVVSEAFPDRNIIGIDCLPLIREHGSLHCLTMQIPRGAAN